MVSNMFLCSPLLGGNDPIWLIYVSNWLKPPTRMGWNIKLVEGIHTYTFLLVYLLTGGNDPIYFPKNYAPENLKTNDLHEPNLHGVDEFHPLVFGIVPLLVNSFKFMRCLYWPYKQWFPRGILVACVVFVFFFLSILPASWGDRSIASRLLESWAIQQGSTPIGFHGIPTGSMGSQLGWGSGRMRMRKWKEPLTLPSCLLKQARVMLASCSQWVWRQSLLI